MTLRYANWSLHFRSLPRVGAERDNDADCERLAGGACFLVCRGPATDRGHDRCRNLASCSWPSWVDSPRVLALAPREFSVSETGCSAERDVSLYRCRSDSSPNPLPRTLRGNDDWCSRLQFRRRAAGSDREFVSWRDLGFGVLENGSSFDSKRRSTGGGFLT